MYSLPPNTYDEVFERGSLLFPFDYHFVNHHHPRFVMPYHYHIDYEVIRIVKGGLTISLNERQYHLNEGDFLFISDGVVHGGYPDSNTDIYECIVFNLQRIYDTAKPNALNLQRLITHQILAKEIFSRKKDEHITSYLDDFFDSVKMHDDENSILAQGLLLSFLGKIFSEHAYTAYEQKLAMRYLKHLNKSNKLFRYIFDNYSKDISLEDMANAVDLNPKYFCKFFKELTKKRPMDYINAFRIECAATRLSSPTESINQIAYSCGFKDPAYFTKLFKRYKNMSPRDYRQKLLTTEPD